MPHINQQYTYTLINECVSTNKTKIKNNIKNVFNATPDNNADRLKSKAVALYKTEFCRNWTELGYCRYGKKCRYAHGELELRSVPKHIKYKTQICRAYHMDGSCPYGIRCTFVHDSDKIQENKESHKGFNSNRRSSFSSQNESVSSSDSTSSRHSISNHSFEYNMNHEAVPIELVYNTFDYNPFDSINQLESENNDIFIMKQSKQQNSLKSVYFSSSSVISKNNKITDLM